MRIALTALALAIILLEATVYVAVGRTIGVLPTLGLGLLSVFVGALLLKRQGMAAMLRIRSEARAGLMPAAALLEGAMLAFAALLMFLPGFSSDVAGLLLFIPVVRRWVARRIRDRLVGQMRPRDGYGRPVASIVELDRSQYAVEPRAERPGRRSEPER